MATDLERRAGVPPAAAERTASFWRTLSSLRGTRIFHPRGGAWSAVAEVPGGAGAGVPLLDRPGTYAATVRLSRGAGLPEPLPDVVGIALRLHDAHGPGRHQDLLMNASLDLPVLHHLMVPVRTGVFSSILAYDVGGTLALFGALRDPREEGGFQLAVARVLRRFTPVADIRLGDRLPQADADALRFNPWHTGGGIRPAGPFQRARAAAYRGSQRGRG
jgi:hypothetical protein